jgi:Thiamine pyrophosphate enzyme, C-terminal TPP binding domain
MDLCLSCKGCKAECPSNVDVARLKAEWLQQRYDALGVPMRARLIGGFSRAMALASIAPGVFNFLVTNTTTANLFKRLAGFAPGRSIPKLNKIPPTSVMLDKKLIIVLLDNRGYGCINRLQQGCGGAPFNNMLVDSLQFGEGAPETDFAANAATLKAISEKVADIAELEAALQRAGGKSQCPRNHPAIPSVTLAPLTCAEKRIRNAK